MLGPAAKAQEQHYHWVVSLLLAAVDSIGKTNYKALS